MKRIWIDSLDVNIKSALRNLKSAILLGVMLFALGVSAEAQQQAKVPKIGWLGAGPRFLPTSPSELFWRDFRKLGYVEGKNIATEYRHADNKLDRLPALAAELIRLKVDLLVAGGTNAALAARDATKTIPIVFLNVSDPVADGLVDSLARPGGNITGFTIISGVLAGKRLELLKERIPKLTRVAVLWDPKNRGSTGQWKENQLPARELGLQLHSMEISSADKIESAFQEAAKTRSAALTVTQNPVLTSRRKQVVELAAKNRLPAIYHQGEFVEIGGLMSYGPDQAEPYRRAAVFVDKILKGAKPADLPVEQPMKFEFIINLKAAKQIGLTIPPNVLARADKVIR
jgi:putative tryptophan/tyrosine transport system substrate-binding protein